MDKKIRLFGSVAIAARFVLASSLMVIWNFTRTWIRRSRTNEQGGSLTGGSSVL